MAEVFIGVLGIALTIVGLGFAYTAWRSKEPRKDEILAWSQECIDIFQRTYLAVSGASKATDKQKYFDVLPELKLRSSVQVERGRLFFLNVKHDQLISNRGLRPIILDCLVANCQICELAPQYLDGDLRKLAAISLQYGRRFVTLAQEEVGRSQQSNSGAEKAGDHVDISNDMMDHIDEREPQY